MSGEDTANSALVTEKPPQILITTNGKPSADVDAVESQPQSKKKDRGKPLRQIIAAFIANLGTINVGLVFGFSAVVIPQLKQKDSVVPIDENQASWIASLSSAGTPVGCILSGYLMDAIGRKRTLLLTEVPLISGWILIAAANNVYLIYVGRLLVGLGSGMVGAPARVYTSEVTQPHLRGMLSALASVGISFGVMLQYALGSLLTWNLLSVISATIPILAFILMCFMPETPNYLVGKDKGEKATKSLARLRGSTYNLQKEIDTMQKFAEQNNQNKKSRSAREIIDALRSPAALKPFSILVLYFMMYQFSGVNTITFYAVEIFELSGTKMDKYTCLNVLGVVRLVFTIVACVSLRRCGRRPLTFISGIGCGVSMIGLGVYMYFKHVWETSDPPVEASFSWVPVACIMMYTITCTLGFLVVPWVMIGEIYPQKVRGIIGGMTTCMAHTFVFIVVKTFPFFKHLLETHGVFIMYGCISLLGTVFLYMCLPETKGKTLQQIEDYFAGRIKSLKTVKSSTTIAPVIIVEKPEKDKLLS